MNNIFERLSNPLEPRRAEVLRNVAAVARQRSTPFMLVGAYARELHFFNVHGVEVVRKTGDVDISIQVRDWDAYNGFSAILQHDYGYRPKTADHPEKLIHEALRQELDLLPFGEIAEDGQVKWPSDNSPWSVVGYNDAFATALTFRLESCEEIAVASIPALVALKIVALHDRPDNRRKDATDIAFIVANYLAVGNRERLVSGPDADILPSCESDLDLASAVMIGRDMARFLGAEARALVTGYLQHEVKSGSRCYLVRGMIGTSFPKFERAREVAAAFLRGLSGEGIVEG